MVRVGPGAPIHLHYRGLDTEEAQTAGGRAVAEHARRRGPDPPGRRHRLAPAAVRPDGRAPPPGPWPTRARPTLLSLYADYAATALDIFSALTDATQRQRHGAGAPLLLGATFTGDHVSDAVQLIADVVPEVTGCDRATIYLWNDRVGHLVPRARTTGREAGAFSGTYAVHRDTRSTGCRPPRSHPAHAAGS